MIVHMSNILATLSHFNQDMLDIGVNIIEDEEIYEAFLKTMYM